MVYWTANSGLVTHIISFLIFLIYVILNYDSYGYWTLFILYTAAAMYMQYFQVARGVEVIRSIQPAWPGTKSGLLWPALLYMIGLVDENDEPRFFTSDEDEDGKSEGEKTEEDVSEINVFFDI